MSSTKKTEGTVTGKLSKVEKKLLDYALSIHPKECEPVTSSSIPEYEPAWQDIENLPHLFVLSCLMDRQFKSEKAWEIPYLVCKFFAPDYSLEKLAAHSEEEYIQFFQKEKLHRFNKDMATVFYQGVHRIMNEYDGDASRIWSGRPSSALVIYRFLCFKGCGVKIASMAANILHRDFGIEYSDYSSLDVSPDTHVYRVMFRLSLIEKKNVPELVIYKARSIYPQYPAVIDKACWTIGRSWCQEHNPDCTNCPLRDVCSSNNKLSATYSM